MNRSKTSLLSALFVLSLSACGLPWEPEGEAQDCSTVRCGPCAPALTLRVSGAPGQAVPEVVMGSGQGACSKDGGLTVCNPAQGGAGLYELDLQAPGYRPVHLVERVNAVERTGCCSCGYEPRTVNVQLVPE
jgi:hypothetical protein